MVPLPSSALTAYAELLDSLIGAPPPSRGVSYFKRTVDEREYWYVQQVVGSRKRSFYLGSDDEPTRELVRRVKQRAEEDGTERATRERVVATCRATGLWAPSAIETRAYEAIAQAGFFGVGGVLVGTHAFMALGNVLGVQWTSTTTRTEDIDVARDPALRVAIDAPGEDLLEALRQREPDFVPVPAFDRGQATTAFKVRGKRLSVSILTPLRGRPGQGPVPIPGLNVAAEPVRFLDFLTTETIVAAIPAGTGILARVPDPARFALHKLVVSQRRPRAMATKSRKDIAQAAELIEALEEIRPGDLEQAHDAVREMPPAFGESLERGLDALAAFRAS